MVTPTACEGWQIEGRTARLSTKVPAEMASTHVSWKPTGRQRTSGSTGIQRCITLQCICLRSHRVCSIGPCVSRRRSSEHVGICTAGMPDLSISRDGREVRSTHTRTRMILPWIGTWTLGIATGPFATEVRMLSEFVSKAQLSNRSSNSITDGAVPPHSVGRSNVLPLSTKPRLSVDNDVTYRRTHLAEIGL